MRQLRCSSAPNGVKSEYQANMAANGRSWSANAARFERTVAAGTMSRGK